MSQNKESTKVWNRFKKGCSARRRMVLKIQTEKVACIGCLQILSCCRDVHHPKDDPGHKLRHCGLTHRCRSVSTLHEFAVRLITHGKHIVSMVTGVQLELSATYRSCRQTALHVIQCRLAQYRAACRKVQDIVYNLLSDNNASRFSGSRLGISHAWVSYEVDSSSCTIVSSARCKTGKRHILHQQLGVERQPTQDS